ncbi:MAG: hypothetical protein Q9213_000240 [Squamulea squamosa]
MALRQAPLLLEISIKLKSGPLFKDAICRLAGDEIRDDKKLETDLDPRMASLVLRKRDGLRQMMREIDNKLVSFTTEYDEDSEDTCGEEGLPEDQGFVTACFRQFIAKRMFERDTKQWSHYAMKYRKLVADVSRMRLDKRVAEAHWQYLKAVYHIPFHISFSPFEKGLKQLSSLVAVGDLYDSAKPLRVPVECLINRHAKTIRFRATEYGPTLLQIASSLEIDWLFKEIVRRICLDPRLDDSSVNQDFPVDLAALIIRKRESLKATMNEIDTKLLLMDIPLGGTTFQDSTVLRSREATIDVIRKPKQEPWRHYLKAYPSVVRSVNQYCSLIEGSPSVSSEKDVVRSLCKKVIEKVTRITWPLYATPLSAVCADELLNHLTLDPEFDLRCVEILDEDLPWNTK